MEELRKVPWTVDGNPRLNREDNHRIIGAPGFLSLKRHQDSFGSGLQDKWLYREDGFELLRGEVFRNHSTECERVP